jgi:hypothetical protein
LFRHDLFEKTGIQGKPGPAACEVHHRIKDAGYRRKQEGALFRPKKAYQPIDIPRKYELLPHRFMRGSKPFTD